MRLFDATDVVVAVVAHPDDAELLFFGTLQLAVARGALAIVIVVTRGERGVSLREEGSRAIVADARLDECKNAFANSHVVVDTLGLPDGQLHAVPDLASRVEAVLQELNCTTLLTHDPQANNDHQDHLALGKAAVNAGRRVAVGTIAAGQPIQPGATFLPTVLVDVSAYLTDKIDALNEHESQAGRWYLSPEFTMARAQAAGWNSYPQRTASGRYYEALRLITALDE